MPKDTRMYLTKLVVLHRIYVFSKFEGRAYVGLVGIVMMIHAASCRLGNSMGHV